MLPELDHVFAEVDRTYEADKLGAFQALVKNDFRIYPASNGGAVHANTIFDEESANSSEELIIFGPFADVEPRKSAEKYKSFADKDKHDFITVQTSQPHSLNQAVKAGHIHNALKAAGRPMRVTTIYGPITYSAWTKEELKGFANGDYTAASQIARLAFKYTQDLLHGPSTSQSRTEAYHFNGVSLGASYAVGSAAAMAREINIGSVTSQEQPLGLAGTKDTFLRFTFKSKIGEESNIEPSEGAVILPNPKMRDDIDGHGNELIMWPQQIGGMLKLAYLKGFSHSECVIGNVMALTAGSPVTFAVGRNSAMTENTLRNLESVQNPNMHAIIVEALKGQFAVHDMSERVPVTTAIALRGISRSDQP